MINKGKSRLLACLGRDIRSFIGLVAINGSQLFDSLKRNGKKIARAILKMYHQQEQMFKQGSHTCANGIISVFQPHVRPIVRGKSKSPTEFGAKIGASIVQEYTFVDHHSWDTYNESSDLPAQIALYRERSGFLPAKIHAGKIYMNKENRTLMKELEIQAMGKPLGRPPKQAQTKEYQAGIAKAVGGAEWDRSNFRNRKTNLPGKQYQGKVAGNGQLLDGYVLLRQNVMEFLRELLYALVFVVNLWANPGNIWRILRPFPKFAYCGFLNG